MRPPRDTDLTDAAGVRPLARRLALGQGWFYVLGGIWPTISPVTFQAVTGAKLDLWLAQTVGFQLALVGLVLLRAFQRSAVTAEIALLAGGTALVLGCVDFYGVTQPRTTGAYLLDALIEFALVAGWLAHWQQRRRREERLPATGLRA